MAFVLGLGLGISAGIEPIGRAATRLLNGVYISYRPAAVFYS